jgi:hypothetical protein
MATATLTFDLSDPDDERAHRYALAGRDALIALERMREHIRSKIKYGDEPSPETIAALERVRDLIPHELVELLV